MNEEPNPEMGQAFPLMEELMKEMMNKIKAMTNTMVGFGTDLKAFGEQLRKPPDQSPVVKEFSRRMEELENNTREEAMRLEKVSKDIEGTGKYLWETAKKVEKIQTGFDEFGKAFRAEFDAFVVRSTLSASVMQMLREDLKDHLQFFEEPRRKEVHYSHFVGRSVWLVIVLVVAVCALSVALVRVTSGH